MSFQPISWVAYKRINDFMTCHPKYIYRLLGSIQELKSTLLEDFKT